MNKIKNNDLYYLCKYSNGLNNPLHKILKIYKPYLLLKYFHGVKRFHDINQFPGVNHIYTDGIGYLLHYKKYDIIKLIPNIDTEDIKKQYKKI